MSDDRGRFYWLKLKEDFFEDETIRWLEERERGLEYVMFYLRLCLRSLKTDGELIRRVGSLRVAYDAGKLAELTRVDVEVAEGALRVLREIGLVEVREDGAMVMTEVLSMVGSESRAAGWARTHRERQKNAETGDALHCQANVSGMSGECQVSVSAMSGECKTENRDKSIENRDKRKSESKRENGASATMTPSPGGNDGGDKPKKGTKAKQAYGEYGNVMLTEEEYGKLTALYPDCAARIERLSGWMAQSGKVYKSHYATIRNWAVRDAEDGVGVKGNGSVRGQAGVVVVDGKEYERGRDGRFYVPGGCGVAVDPYAGDGLF